MNRIWKKGLILAAAGFLAGILIGAGILYLEYPEAYTGGYTAGRMMLYLFLCGLHGAWSMGTSVIYDIEHWSITRSTVTHFVLILCSFYLMGLAQGWLEFFTPFFWFWTAGFIVTYCLIWIISYFSYRRKVRELNRDLRKWRTEHQQKEKQ